MVRFEVFLPPFSPFFLASWMPQRRLLLIIRDSRMIKKKYHLRGRILISNRSEMTSTSCKIRVFHFLFCNAKIFVCMAFRLLIILRIRCDCSPRMMKNEYFVYFSSSTRKVTRIVLKKPTPTWYFSRKMRRKVETM